MERPGAQCQFAREARRKVVTQADLIAEVVLGDPLVIQQGVLPQGRNVPGTRIVIRIGRHGGVACPGSARRQKPAENHSLHTRISV